MRRTIKFVLSDLHIGRGLYRGGVHNPVEDFRRDSEFSEFLMYHSSEHEGDDVEIIFNGDIFDVVRSVGLESPTKQIKKSDVFNFLDEAFSGHSGFFKALSDFMWSGGKVAYIIGNHDQPFACPDVQKYLLEKIKPPEGMFKIFVRDYFFDGLWVEHGHRYEVLNRIDVDNVWIKSKDGSEVLNMPWGLKFVVEFINPLRVHRPYIDKMRPLKTSLKWGAIFDTSFTLKNLLRLFWYWFRHRTYFDPVRKRRFTVSLKLVGESMGHASCDRAAEAIILRQGVKVVVLGHTHKAMLKRFEGGKIYINSGAWVDFISLGLPRIGLQSRLSFVFLEKTADGYFASLRVWRGTHRVEEDVTTF